MKMFDTVKESILDGLEYLKGKEPYACDVHSHLFNEAPPFIYPHRARKVLNELDVFAAIGAVQRWENWHFGKVNTDLAQPADVANMALYILGYETLHEIFGDTVWFTDKWNSRLEDEDLDGMLAHAKAWFDERPNGIRAVWDDVEK